MTDKITIDRTVVEHAMDALNLAYEGKCRLDTIPDAIDALQAVLSQPVLVPQPDGLPMVIAGALFDFAGFLTSRAKIIAVGASANAAPMVELIKEFGASRGLNLDDAAVLSWHSGLQAALANQQEKQND